MTETQAFKSPREMARAFTPDLAAFVEDPLFSKVWLNARLTPRDRSLATVAALVVMHRPEELPAHLKRAVTNGLEKAQISALITHLAFYGGFPAAISASAIAAQVLGSLDSGQ